MVLVIDNYDSFTYNLVQYLGELQVELQVRRNDEVTLDAIRAGVYGCDFNTMTGAQYQIQKTGGDYI